MGKGTRDSNNCGLGIFRVKHTFYYHFLRDQKTRELGESLSQDHKANEWQNWNLNLGKSSSKARREGTHGRG